MKVTVIDYPDETAFTYCKKIALLTTGISWDVKIAEPDELWIRRMFRAMHSPIRVLQYGILIEDIPYFLAMHITRHKVGFESFVQTQRNDRQDKFDREWALQSNPITMFIQCNAEALITFLQKRLCRKAWESNKKEGRIGMDDVANTIRDKVLKVTPELKEMLQPPCVINQRCHEFHPCKIPTRIEPFTGWVIDE